MAIPTFSGLRKDSSEFRAIWKSMAETASYNKTALAHELLNLRTQLNEKPNISSNLSLSPCPKLVTSCGKS
jgi:hypothetical protein